MELKIVLFTKSNCPLCDAVKRVLNSKGLPYETVSIEDEKERQAFFEKCGPSVRQMPQAFFNDQRVGGLEGVQAALKQLGL